MRASDLVFFGSGLAALVYQTVWARLLARLLGSDASGTAVVLAVFMGGMALGAALAGRLARTARRPVALFVGIELALAAWAAASPWLLGAIEPVGGLAAQAGVAALALAGPTVLMGATFPLMGRLTIARAADVGRETSAFYGANTLGAAAGAVAGPFALMPTLGLTGALLAAAGLEVAVAAAASVLLSDAASMEPEEPPVRARSLALEPFAWAAFAMGFSALALEVLLTRLLVSVTGASIYAFAIVLAVFLAGIGLGSRWIAPEGPREGGGGHAGLFRRSALAIAPLTLLGLAVLEWRTGERDLFAGLANRMPASAGVARLWTGHALLAGLALLPPALAFGRALPSAVAAAAERHPGRAREPVLAAVYAANTAGALLGALVAGFVLLPLVGLRLGVAAALAPSFAAALLAPRRDRAWLVSTAGAAAFGWLALAPAAREGTVVVDLAHGPHATVSVEDHVEEDGGTVRSLRINGKVVATTAPVDLRLQRLLAHVPALLHGDVRTALVIGMGTGMTAGALLDLPELESLVVVEVSSVVPTHGAAWFAGWSAGLLEDPRTEVVVADGRHYLARARATYDLVTSDPIHPWTAGSSDLYSLEHFERMRGRLAAGGVASQWLPLYQLSAADVRTVAATWCAAFPRTAAYLAAYDLVLVGASDGLAGPEALASRPFPPRVAASLREVGVHAPEELAALRVADDAELRAFAGGCAPMRDDLPVLEFRAPRSYLAGYCTEALAWAARPGAVDTLPPESRGRAREVRAALARFLERLPHGWSAAAAAYGRELLALPPTRAADGPRGAK